MAAQLLFVVYLASLFDHRRLMVLFSSLLHLTTILERDYEEILGMETVCGTSYTNQNSIALHTALTDRLISASLKSAEVNALSF